MSRHVIWSNIDLDTDDWKDFLEEEYPEIDDDFEKYQLVADLNNSYLDDERMNLRKDVGAKIVIIADLGLWFGRRRGYRLLNSSNLGDCLYSDPSIEYADWYVEDGEFCGTGIHHDGTNRYVYRALRDDAEDDLLEAVLDGAATVDQVLAATRSLAADVQGVYGW